MPRLLRWLELVGASAVLLLGSLGALVLATLWGVAVVLTPLGLGIPLTLLLTGIVRWFTDQHRTWAGQHLPEPVERPYRPPTSGNHLVRCRSLLKEPATWRDGSWLVVDAVAGWFTAGLTFLLFAIGVVYLVYPLVVALTPESTFRTPFGSAWTINSLTEAFALVPVGGLTLCASYLLATPLAVLNARVVRSLLGPTRPARLQARVDALAASRADTVDAQAGELRRIERDLHDGAQARLAALGMSLGLAEHLIDADPQAARQLLSEARASTSSALTELRDLVRGIHPPVLADRGLEGAVQALALVNPTPTTLDLHLPGRLPAPIESAAYFAVAECLTNATKHAQAHHIAIGITHTDADGGRLNLSVKDDGRGGASDSGGSGLRGIARRLAAFDGTLTVDSPAGGPTEIRMVLPCAS
ncbi:sensor histidine kinase [Kineosporia mesophila]|uniref:sensor histidine kinase n=1 Tax=Kineosporia mesophila TaxID=566012 RepID=UPI001E5A61BB|nr:sensor domain-containing protein [Kineosporia mesophila]